MDKQILVLIFESIPESFMLLSLGLALYGYEIKKRWVHILIAAIIQAVFTYITRNYIEINHIRILLNTGLFLFVVLSLRIKLLDALLISFTSAMILIITESFLVIIVTNLFNQSIGKIIENVWLNIFLPFPYILFLTILAFYLNQKKFSLLKLNNGNYKKNTNSLYLAVLILVFTVILAIINLGIVSRDSFFREFISGQGIIILTTILALDIYLMIKVVSKLFKINQQENLLIAQENYLKHLKEVMAILRKQRHDFNNHIEVLYALHCEKNYDEERKYLQKLVGEIDQVNSLIRIDNPPLGALLNTKCAIAEAKGINMEVTVETSLKKLAIDSFLLVKVLGNIIDNAIDATLETENKKIEIEIEKLLDNYVIKVYNSGSVIEKEDLEKIFQPGFTTKKDSHAGIGLPNAQEIVKRYGGEIKVKSGKGRGTTFTIILPANSKKNMEEKIWKV